ncbi:MAG: hypothetical protein VW270_00800 [Candidatus Poseidoniales archaeon]
MSARKVLSALGATALVVAFSFLLAFVLINFMLGCETWDESLWTEYNSCITLGHIIDGIGGKR